MPLDAVGLATALGSTAPDKPYHHLCRTQLAAYRDALATGEPLLVCCAQEAPLFREVAAAAGAPIPAFVDIRDRAGWSSQAAQAMPKMAALIAEAMAPLEPTPAVTLTSSGSVVVIGRGEVALSAARRMAAERRVTCILLNPDPGTAPPPVRPFATFAGSAARVSGHLGTFQVRVSHPAALSASARQTLVFEPEGTERVFAADIVFDLTGGAPLLAARDGLLRADPGNPAAVTDAVHAALALVGEFEKPRYIRFIADLCAHSRNLKVACTRCLDACPSSAIQPDGDHVKVDASVCMGHGECVSACPTGAMNFDYPAGNGVFGRLRSLLTTYAKAGGERPVLLVYQQVPDHDDAGGDAVLSALARYGDGLPAHVLPFAMAAVGAFGLELMLTACAYGCGGVVVLAAPQQEPDLAPLARAAGVTDTVMAGLGWEVRVRILATADPDELASALAFNPPIPVAPAANYLVIGDRRSTMALALDHLRTTAPVRRDEIALPAEAPFGAVVVRQDGCTLCLSCIGVCPTGALSGHADKASLGFTETACVQCGLCRATCPEKVITLVPRLNLRRDARERQVLKEEEPYLCTRCGTPFGTKSSIEALLGRLAGHSMFAGSGRLDLIGMCGDCRVVAQYELEEGNRPFQLGDRPIPRTTDDYLREREAEAGNRDSEAPAASFAGDISKARPT